MTAFFRAKSGSAWTADTTLSRAVVGCHDPCANSLQLGDSMRRGGPGTLSWDYVRFGLTVPVTSPQPREAGIQAHVPSARVVSPQTIDPGPHRSCVTSSLREGSG